MRVHPDRGEDVGMVLGDVDRDSIGFDRSDRSDRDDAANAGKPRALENVKPSS